MLFDFLLLAAVDRNEKWPVRWIAKPGVKLRKKGERK
jgi:hypothetical protein